MQKFKTFLTVIGAVTVLVLAANTAAFAATGGKFILGKTNKASKVSTLKRTTAGSPLNLVTKSGANAPFTTNGGGKVANLNADKIDGKDSSAFASASSQPIARGFINTGGGTTPTVGTGSTGVSAVSWDAGNSRYVVTVTGQPYYFNKYVTMITPVCQNLPAMTSSVGNNLLVKFGAGTACSSGFAYLIYKIA
jgi:hypothetical protein